MQRYNYELEYLIDDVKEEHNYLSETKKEVINSVKGNYPQLCTYESEWIYFDETGYIPGEPVEIEYQTVEGTNCIVENAIPYHYKSAILKGNTKYRDIDTGDILDTFDETKNLELVSVKMPVLKTTGKNLFDVNSLKETSPLINNYKIHGSTVSGTPLEIFVGLGTSYIPVKKGEAYTVSCKIISNTSASIEIRHYNDMSNTEMNNALHTETTNSIKTIYPLGNILKITLSNGDKKEYTEISDIQIEEGTVATPYEPYKSNILTVNEDVTLRSNGDVYDELNLLTGRLTQRIDENNEVLAQAVVKTVDLTPTTHPFEGYNNFTTSSDTIPPIMNLQVPVVSTGEQTLQEINE